MWSAKCGKIRVVPAVGPDERRPRRRVAHPGLLVGSSVAILSSALVLTAKDWRGWHTNLFLWGLTVTGITFAYPLLNERLALRLVPDASAERRKELHSRQRLNAIDGAIMALGAAVLAAGTGWTVVDAVATAMILAGGGLSTLGGVLVIRRRRAQSRR